MPWDILGLLPHAEALKAALTRQDGPVIGDEQLLHKLAVAQLALLRNMRSIAGDEGEAQRFYQTELKVAEAELLQDTSALAHRREPESTQEPPSPQIPATAPIDGRFTWDEINEAILKRWDGSEELEHWLKLLRYELKIDPEPPSQQEAGFMQQVGPLSCLRCPWKSDADLTWQEKENVLRRHLDEAHPGWQSEAIAGTASVQPSHLPANTGETNGQAKK